MTYDQAKKIKETAKEMKDSECTYNYGGYPMFRELAKQLRRKIRKDTANNFANASGRVSKTS